MLMRPYLLTLLAALPLSVELCAQKAAPVIEQKAEDGLWLVAPQVGDALMSVTRSFSQGITIDGKKNVWCLVQSYEVNKPKERTLWLYRSKTGGRSWQRVTKAGPTWSAYGGIAGEPDSEILHVAWAARLNGAEHSSAVYQRFDAGQGVWLGEPQVLQEGVGAQDQFSVSDLAMAADGVLTVLVATHRHPKQPPWPSGWSTGVMTLQPGQKKWSGPYPIHTNRYGVWANLQVRDGRVHTTYRSSPSHSIIGYRSFSLANQKYDQKKDVEVSVQPKTGRSVANASALVVGPFGNRTVVYPAAKHPSNRAGNGQLLIAFAGADDKWRTEVLCEDPKMASGNVGHEHFALVKGPGPQVIALYSKVSEDHKVLYRRIVDSGKPMGPERVVARCDKKGAFHRIVAVRDPRYRTGIWAVVAGSDEAITLGVRAVLAPRPPSTRWQ